jgi:ubiquinone/menaquinone biosynthesis C-methylase UbiE
LLTLALAARVRQVLAVDSSPGMLAVLAQKAKDRQISNVEILCADFTNGPAPAGPYDLITSAMTLHHVADTQALFRCFFALLAPDGQIALADLDAEDGSFHGHSDGIPHAGFDRETLVHQLADSGFADIQLSTAARIEKNARAYTVFLATARKP